MLFPNRSPDSAGATPSDEDTPYCPECGHVLNEPRPDRSRPPTSNRWWSWVLVAVGTSLVVVFGPRAWHASTDLGLNQAALRTLSEVSATAPVDKVSREVLARVEASLAVRRPLALAVAAADRELARSRVVVALGVATVLLGLGALARDGVVQARHPGSTRGDDGTPDPTRRVLVEVMRGLWALCEATLTASLLLFLMVFGATALSRLFHGVPPTRELVDQALNRTLDDVVVLVGMLA